MPVFWDAVTSAACGTAEIMLIYTRAMLPPCWSPFYSSFFLILFFLTTVKNFIEWSSLRPRLLLLFFCTKPRTKLKLYQIALQTLSRRISNPYLETPSNKVLLNSISSNNLLGIFLRWFNLLIIALKTLVNGACSSIQLTSYNLWVLETVYFYYWICKLNCSEFWCTLTSQPFKWLPPLFSLLLQYLRALFLHLTRLYCLRAILYSLKDS